ncbi:TAXI family TRAP transporter solute-binding subunit [Geomicrobium sp. JCM 19055]|uniref:TAXI family TRAP transporter solute-binding subunit n=1 Tax=Geomicrobium sp. JCM 19055 TaxID=1460649 RepID=UPI00045EDB4F|nr:TAXI family TRAP transporter solute-binding subunit [Geomicrobium sp. JCM 19055]GAK00105.1 TRAP transporter solute receptor, TAXI family precursor [Geomicrobium sp. JCM 19055]
MKFQMVLFLFLSIFFVITGCSNESNANESGNQYVFSTQGLGTSFNTMTNAFTTIYDEKFNDGTEIHSQTTSPGGIAASYIIEQQTADITIGNAAPAIWAYEDGILDRPPVQDVRSVGGGLDAPVAIVVFTENFVNRTGYTTLEEVIDDEYPVRIASKDTGSFGEVTQNVILSELGVTYDDIRSWGGNITLTDSSNVIDMLRDNRADITIDHTNLNQANYVELSLTTGLHFAQLSDSLQDRLFEQGYARQTIPAGSFNGVVSEDMQTVGSPTTLLVHKSMPDDHAYILAKEMAENKEALVSSFSAFQDFEPENACEPTRAGAPLHPGAEQYYKESGCLES